MLILYSPFLIFHLFCGQRWIRTTEDVRQLSYSQLHLATLVSALIFSEPLVGFEPTTPRLQITCSGQLS